MKNILVTGGCGFIGSNLVKKLLEKGYPVTVFDNFSSSRKDWKDFYSKLDANLFVDEVIGDYSHPDRLENIRSGLYDAVFHTAAVPRVLYSVENPLETFEENVSKTIKLIHACIEGNVKRFIFSSSSSVYGGADVLPTPETYKKSPKSPYAWHKSSIEDYLKTVSFLYEMDTVSLRYFNVFGPGQWGDSAYATAVSAWCNAVKNNKPLRSDGTGEQSRDLCYIDNTVQANILALEYKDKLNGECFNVACGDRTSNNQILEFFNNKYKKIEIVNAPFRKGDVMHTKANISKIKEVLEYKSPISFWDGLEKTLEWWNI